MPSNAPDDGAPFFDRDQARAVLDEHGFGVEQGSVVLDRLAACVRPVAGIVLTPEEAADAAGALRAQLMRSAMTQRDKDRLNALAARLEASRG